MVDTAVSTPAEVHEHPLARKSNVGGWAPFVFVGLLAAGLAYMYFALTGDLENARAVPWVLLILALICALGFEFVNGFHDTANAVATVIYTHSMPAEVAVIWSGIFNFLGVISASGAVAYGIISLLPVELIMQVGSGAGLAMVFALLIAAILWNVGTWYLGLPASSSHTLIGQSSASASPTSLWRPAARQPAASIGARPPRSACRS